MISKDCVKPLDKKLSKKERKFVAAVLNPDIETLGQAALKAGCETTNPNVLGAVMRLRLSEHIDSAKQLAAIELDTTIKSRLQMLFDIYELSKTDKDFSTATRCIENLLRVFGDNAPVKAQVQHDVEIKSYSLVEQYTKDY